MGQISSEPLYVCAWIGVLGMHWNMYTVKLLTKLSLRLASKYGCQKKKLKLNIKIRQNVPFKK